MPRDCGADARAGAGPGIAATLHHGRSRLNTIGVCASDLVRALEPARLTPTLKLTHTDGAGVAGVNYC